MMRKPEKKCNNPVFAMWDEGFEFLLRVPMTTTAICWFFIFGKYILTVL